MPSRLRILCGISLWVVSSISRASENPPESPPDSQSDPLDMSPPYQLPQWPGSTRLKGPKSSLGASIGSRGTLSEGRTFDETMNAELFAGLPFWNGIDLSLAAGRFLMQGSTIRFEGGIRSFLFWTQGGPYVSFAWGANRADDSLSIDDQPVLTLGLFGGSGLYAELDLRASSHRPVAAIFEWGIRIRAPLFQDNIAPSNSDSSSPITAQSMTEPLEQAHSAKK
jgi:hypothetical protein